MGLFGISTPDEKASYLQNAFAEQEKLKAEQALRDQEEARRNAQILALQTQTPKQSQQQGGGGINPMQFMNQGSSGNGGLGGILGGGMTPTASAQASGTVGAHAAPYAGGGGSSAASGASGAGSGAWSSLAGFWPAALIALGVGNDQYQHNIGNRDDESFRGEDSLKGTALLKDAPVWGKKADKYVPGSSDSFTIGATLGSPTTWFEGDTWENLGDSLKRGGTLGGILRKVF